ncbi:MAG: tetratricopeptide repeat protein [Anaerolineae bacterium]|nr:tetratricopeptide repeat protein [Anaerolineae bacterium]
MAEINLRDYLARLESLVSSGEYTQVVHHCRHILQYFPRHADTYRLLGRALLDNNKWQEAAEVFNRLQSVTPSDYTAHVALAEISNQLKRPDEAIWHLERAFEQQSNNQTLMDNLRDLYRRHRRQEFNRVQLTAGAAARQYIRNGLFEQAIRVLQEALQQTPERVDLRLLLAQTYREAGYYVEAGETSLDVLQTLPDCLDANLILAELWLSLQRPSDAQRYLERVQAVDPYAALQMVESDNVSADAFRLPELDFRRSVEREVLSGTPDWLESVDSKDEQPSAASNDLQGWSSFTPASGAQTDDLQLDSDFRQELPADWMQTGELPSSGPLPPVEPPKRTGGITGGLLSRFRTGGLPGTGQVSGSGQLPPMDEEDDEVFEPAPILPPVPPPRNKPPTQEVPAVSSRFATPDETKRFDESLMDPLGAPTSDEILAPSFDDNDPLYWMKQGDSEDSSDPRRTTASVGIGEDNILAATDTDDPMAWMQDYGTGLLADEPGPSRLNRQDAVDDSAPLSTEVAAVDPMAWMRDYSNDMLTEEAAAEARNETSFDDEQSNTAEEDGDPLAWLRGSGVEVVDDTPERTTATQQTIPVKADPLDWLSDDESLLNEALDMEALVDNNIRSAPLSAPQPTASIDRQNAMPQSPDNDLNWLSSQDEPEPDEFDWSQTATPNEPPPEASRKSGMLNRFRTGNLPITNPVGDEPVMPSIDDGMDFMDDIPMPSTGPVGTASSPASDFDWSATPEASTEDTGWLDDMMTPDQPDPAPEDVPDWLGGMNIQPPAAATATWFESSEPEEEPPSSDVKRTTGLLNRFRTGNLPGTNSLPEDESATPATGWLDEMMESEAPNTQDDSTWLMDTGALSGSSVRATDELGWGQPDEAPPATGWLDDMMTSEPGPVQDEAAWLMDTGPLSAPTTDEFAWAKTTQDIAPATGWLDEMMTTQEPEQPAAPVPEWLTGLEEPPAAPPTIAGTGGLLDRFRTGNLPATNSLTEESDDDGWGDQGFGQPQQASESDMPDWLAQTGALMNPEASAESAIDEWMAETGSLSNQAESAPQSDIPDWLVQTGELVDSANASTQEAEPISGWMDEIQPESAVTSDWADASTEATTWENDQFSEEPATGMRTTGLLNRFQTGQLPITSGLESASSEPEAVPDWLSGIGASAETAPTFGDLPQEDDVAAWMAQTGSLLESAAKSSSTNEWAIVDDEVIPDQPSMTTTGLLNRFKTGNLPSTGSIESDSDEIDFGWSTEAQPASQNTADVPDWLQTLDTSEVEAVVEPDIMPKPGTGPIDQINWGDQLAQPAAEANYPDDEVIEEDSIPDWLMGAEPQEEPVAASPRTGTTPLDQIDWGMQAAPVAEDDYLDEEPVQQADIPDWLAQAEPAQPEFEIEQPQAGTAPLDQIDWDMQAAPVAEDDYLDEEPVQQADIPDWLAQAEPTQPEFDIEQPQASTAPLDEMDWDLSEEPVAETEFVQEVVEQPLEMPGWLEETESAQSELVEEMAEATAIESSDNFNWVAQADEVTAEVIDAQEEELSPIEDDLSWMRSTSFEETEAVATSDEPDWDELATAAEPDMVEAEAINQETLMAEAPIEAEADSWTTSEPVIAEQEERKLVELDSEWDEELETSPALNAPDWLNDMVPGLDISYDVEEDATPEEDYASAAPVIPGTLRPKVDYAWLMDIADEESRYMLPVTDTILARKRRYIFTREPVWLRQPTEKRDATPANAESDIDLPPWLQ